MSTNPKHPCAGRSQAQIEAFESIAVGMVPRCGQATINALFDAGLIVLLGHKVVGRDAFGAVEVPVYEVPVHHHIRWCEWCEAQPDEEGLRAE